MPEDIYERIASRANTKFSLSRQLATALFFILAVATLNYYAPAHSNSTERFYASLMLVLVAGPLWLWRLGIDHDPPFIVLLSVIYFYTYGLGVFLLRSFSGSVYGSDISPQWVEAALRLSLEGMVCMLAGYYAWPWLPVASVMPRFRMRWTDRRAVRAAGYVLAIGGVAASLAQIPGLPKSLGQLMVYAQDSTTVGMCILLGLWLMGMVGNRQMLLLFAVLVPLRLGTGLIGGASGGAIFIILTLVLMYAALSHRIPWILVLAGTAAMFVIRPLELPYRAATWYPQGELYHASNLQKAEYMYGLIERTAVGGEVPPEVLIQAAAGRLSMFPMLADVVSETPSVIPYWSGASYYSLPFKLIPRIIWPGKPEEVTGRTFGHRYGYTPVEDPGTSINFAQEVELYANFGSYGVIIGMLIFGMIYRSLLSMFVHPQMGFGALIAAVFVVSSLFDIETGTGLVFGGIPWTLIYIGAINAFVMLLHFEISDLDRHAATPALR